MKICLGQLNPTIGAIEENTKKIIQTIEHARKNGVQLVIFPEMAIPGYFPDDLLLESDFILKVENALHEIIGHTQNLAVIIGLPRRAHTTSNKPLCNSAAVIYNGDLLGYQDKMLLPTYDVFDERRYFQPGQEEKTWVLFDKKIGLSICEDIWCHHNRSRLEHYPDDPISFFEKQNLDLFINISASPYALGKLKMREQVVEHVASRLHCPVILCNQIGAQDGIIFDGSSLVFSKDKELLLQCKSFEEDTEIFDLDSINPKTFTLPEMPQELFLALGLGVKDYFRKQGFSKACIGLSGGLDSSVVASIAVHALGKENVMGILLPSRFTTPESIEDALYVASNLGIHTIEIPIDGLFQNYLDTLHPLFEKKPQDTTEENIQARVRGMLLMALSNKFGSLLLNTGNKSELAVGYTTLYGDACGSISVIGDLLKTQVYQVAEWIKRTYGWIPDRVITKAPSAELKENQKDTDTLGDYLSLDAIVEDYIVHAKSIDEIVESRDIPKERVTDIVRKIHTNEYKRRQCPFPFRVSEKAFSVGRKVPIVHQHSR